jgi:hypothetical protein
MFCLMLRRRYQNVWQRVVGLSLQVFAREEAERCPTDMWVGSVVPDTEGDLLFVKTARFLQFVEPSPCNIVYIWLFRRATFRGSFVACFGLALGLGPHLLRE